jgi:hypothetical protein
VSKNITHESVVIRWIRKKKKKKKKVVAATIKVVELHVVLRDLKWQVRLPFVTTGMFGS